MAYVATGAAGKYSVTAINTGTNHVTATIPIGFEASYMAVTPDAKHVYVAGASSTSYGSVAVIDTVRDSVVATIRVPYEPQGIVASPDGTKVYVISAAYVSNPNYYTSSTISTIDTATNAVVAVITRPEFDSSVSISPDGKTLYVAAGVPCGCASGLNGAYIDLLNTATGVVSEFSIPTMPYSAQEVIYNVVISPNDAKLYSNHSYYSQSYVDEIAVLNPSTPGIEITKLPAVLTVGVFSPNSQYLYGLGLGGVGVINTTTDVSTTAVANIPGASALAITPDGRHLYITDVSTGSVLVADTATYTISTVLPLSVATSGAIAIVPAL